MKRNVLLFLLACAAAGTAAAYWLASGRGQVRQPSRAERLLLEALPHVEQVLGYKLSAAPEVREVSAGEFRRLPGWELKAFLHWKYPALTGDARDVAYQVAHHSHCAASPCRHVEGTRIVLVAGEHLPAIAAWKEPLRAADSDAFLQLAIVHEVVRLALEQRHQLLDRRHDPQSLEEYLVGQALRDGRAQWVTRAVAKRLGSESVFPLLAERFLHVPDAAPDAQQKMACQTSLQQRRQGYLAGLAFFDHLDRQNLGDVERLAFERPPRQFAWVLRPELYVKLGLSDEPDLRRVLQRVQAKHSPPGMQGAPQSWTPAMLRQVAELVGLKEQSLRVVPTWDDGRSLIWSDPAKPGRYIAVTVARFATEAQARSYHGFAIDLQRKRDEVSAKTPQLPVRTVESRFTTLRLDGLEECVRNDKTVQATDDGPTLPVTILLGRSGRVVVELQWQGVAADAEWARHVIAECLR